MGWRKIVSAHTHMHTLIHTQTAILVSYNTTHAVFEPNNNQPWSQQPLHHKKQQQEKQQQRVKKELKKKLRIKNRKKAIAVFKFDGICQT